MSSAVARGIICPINMTPTCLDIAIGDRGTSESGRLKIGLIIAADKGLLCGDDGLQMDPCFVQKSQFGVKVAKMFSSGKIYTTGIRP